MIAVCGKIYLFGGGVWSSQHGWTEQYNETWLYNPGIYPHVTPLYYIIYFL